MKHKFLHKLRLKRKHKRMFAAVASAAVLSSALLPGIPIVKVHAAGSPPVSDSAKAPSGSVAPSEPVREVQASQPADNPVEMVRDRAPSLGFSKADSFSLQTKAEQDATVKVRSSDGQTYEVELRKNDANWRVVTIRGLGDSSHPATYRTGNF